MLRKNMRATRKSRKRRSKSTSHSPSSRKNTEPSWRLSTLVFCVRTFLLENWNVWPQAQQKPVVPCVPFTSQHCHVCQPLRSVPIPSAKTRSGQLLGLPERLWGHIPSAPPLGCLRLVLLFSFLPRATLPPTHQQPLYILV